MLKKLRKESFKKVGVTLAALLLVAGVLLAAGAYNIVYKFQGTKDIYALDSEDLLNSYSMGEIYLIYDSISEIVDRNGNTVEREYLIPMGNDEYMVARFPKEYIPLADKVLEESVAFLKGESAEMPQSVFYATGKVVKMDKELLDIYHTYVNYDDLEEADRELYLPYVWTVGRMGGVSNTYVYIAGLLSIALIIAAIVIFIKWAGFGYQREIRRSKHRETALAVISRTQPVRENAYLTADFIIFNDGARTRLVEAADIRGVSVSGDYKGKYVRIELKKGSRRLYSKDADYLAELIGKTYRLDKHKVQTEKYKSILEG